MHCTWLMFSEFIGDNGAELGVDLDSVAAKAVLREDRRFFSGQASSSSPTIRPEERTRNMPLVSLAASPPRPAASSAAEQRCFATGGALVFARTRGPQTSSIISVFAVKGVGVRSTGSGVPSGVPTAAASGLWAAAGAPSPVGESSSGESRSRGAGGVRPARAPAKHGAASTSTRRFPKAALTRLPAVTPKGKLRFPTKGSHRALPYGPRMTNLNSSPAISSGKLSLPHFGNCLAFVRNFTAASKSQRPSSAQPPTQ
mmetsp:Transcript_117288/g.328261  ORF Transcript_117288/g.328261 Transcript_117288/m.328261 type:complete len:257 (+) Transcript_117288:1543-2313(+)